MRFSRILLLAVAALVSALVSRPVFASSAELELTPFAGYYIASDLYNTTGAKVELTNSFMWGARLTANPNHRAGVEFAYTRTGSDAKLSQAQGSQPRTDIGHVDFDNYDINFLGYQPSGNPRVTPFGMIGFGWAVSHPEIDSDFVSPGQSIDGNTLFNFNFGLGTKIEMNEKISLRLEGRWRVTDTSITTSSGIWCDPWGYCYSYSTDWYNSGELIGGLTYKFQGR